MVEQEKCFFCNPNLNREVYLYQGAHLDSYLEDCPVTPGHFLIFPKRHIEFFNQMSTDEWAELSSAIKTSIIKLTDINLVECYTRLLQQAYSKNTEWFLNNILKSPYIKLRAENFNIGLNDGYIAGKTAGHLHWHVIPRFKGDVINPIGGVRNVIPDLADYKTARE